MMKSQRRLSGFTMIELLIVIGIMAVLMAIIVPIGKRLSDSNRTSRCEAQLSHIGQALKLYYLDEQGVPPMAVDATGVANFDLCPGLDVLYRMEYLGNRQTLHCPQHTKTAANETVTTDTPEYYWSYMVRDPKAKPSSEAVLQYKYMPYRFADVGDYPDDYLRQLTRNTRSVSIGGTTYTVTGHSPEQPPDNTMVTWCNYHADRYKINKHGQYVTLFWDGSVRLLDQELFTDGATGPPEAWLIEPTDIAH
ncbi:MAG: type II secretion system protein [Armatimonadota bacterium]